MCEANVRSECAKPKGKGVDEWLSGSGFRSTAEQNPEIKEATAACPERPKGVLSEANVRSRRVRPWSFTFLVCVFCFLFLIFYFNNPAWSNDRPSIDLDRVSIPKEFGLIKEVYQPPAVGKKVPIIVFHIQDVHANYEAQKNLANILEYLIQAYGAELILVEGGITDKDFSYLRDWAPLEERKQKAEGLLKKGVISGETYVDIATDFPLKFQGIEDKELYEENMELYLKVDTFRKDALKLVGEFRDIAERLKKFIYTKRLKRFDECKDDYKSEKMGLVEYLKYLNDIASKEGVGLKDYPHHSALLETAHLEREIDFNKVEGERDNLIKRLNSILPKERLSELVIMGLKFKEDEISDGEFYSYLRSLSIKNKIDMDKYENLNRYVDYITSYEKLKSKEVFKEINKIEDIIRDALCKNDEQKRLFKLSENLSDLEAFLRLKLAPEDFDYYKAHKKDFNTNDWKAFLKKNSERFHLKAPIPEDTSVIDKNFDTLEAFYEAAFKRDDAFLRNSLRRIEKEKAKTAVLITGGFHTKNLTRLFMSNNISYIVITPKMTQKTDDELYDRILKESYKTRIW